MADASSLILQMKASGGLNVDTTPLDEILLNISQTLKNHEVIISNLPKVETAQSDLRRELNRLRIAIESVNALDGDGANTVGASVGGEFSSPTLLNNDALSVSSADDSYGVRKCYIDPIQQRHHEDTANANYHSLAKGLFDVKGTIRRMQRERDEGLVNSMEIDDGIRSLKEDLLDIQQKLTSFASVAHMQMIQQSIATKHGQIEQYIEEFKSKFREEVNGNINHNLSDVKSWFKDLEALVKQRQEKLEACVSSCAKEYDVNDFRESIQLAVEQLVRKATYLDDTAKAQGKTLIVLQQKNAFTLFHRHYTNWKRNSLQKGLSRWKRMVQQQVQYEKGKSSQKRLMRKILTGIMSRRKRLGFDKWIRFRDWHRKVERKKLKASTLMAERLGLYFAAPKTAAFNKWRRITVMDKMKCSYGEDRDDERAMAEEKIDTTSIDRNTRQKAYDLTSIIDSFKEDAHGASYALAQEIEIMKTRDLANLRKDLSSESTNMVSSLRHTMDDAFQRVQDAAIEFQEAINKRVDSCSQELAGIKELNNLIKHTKSQLKNIEESHGKRMDILHEREDKMEQRLSVLEKQTKINVDNVSKLLAEQAATNESIQYLRDTIAKNEKLRDEERNNFSEVLNSFGDELLKTKVKLGHTQVHCETLEQELSKTKAEVTHFQNSSQAENEKVQRTMNHPGIPKPSLDRIVKVGNAYENLAREKSYVMGINVMATMKTVITAKLKTKVEKHTYEEEVDVPAEIAAFGHDYAAWIAYQADHESLLRLIAGTNPDELVYAEEDLTVRREGLLDELKSSLEESLERASYLGDVGTNGNDGSAKESKSSRGMGLRWEARSIFLARLMDATDTALSKHDQILIPATTRLGRVRPLSSNVTVCVACDRPMRTKSRHSSCKGEASNSRMDGKTDKLPDGSMPVNSNSNRAGISPVLESKGQAKRQVSSAGTTSTAVGIKNDTKSGQSARKEKNENRPNTTAAASGIAAQLPGTIEEEDD